MENHKTKPGFIYTGPPVGRSIFLNDLFFTEGIITGYRPPIPLPCRVYNYDGTMETIYLPEVYEIDETFEVDVSRVFFI